MKKLFSVIDEVEKLLTKYPPLRDSDERLMANIWWKAIPNLGDVNGKDILSMLAKRELPSYESVSRCRRKIQEMHPSLRGNKWEDRHKRAEKIRSAIPEPFNSWPDSHSYSKHIDEAIERGKKND